MKRVDHVYKTVGAKKNKGFKIDYDLRMMPGEFCLAMVGVGWIDHKYEIIKMLAKRYSQIVTDTDLIAHDDYIASLGVGTKVYFIHGGSNVSASLPRIKLAMAKLRRFNIKCQYFASAKSFTKKTGFKL